ncbi:MAG: NAD(P)H-hydrate dehydratase [Campylobacterales bacterium]|nr:NAD(P)H-hydrate dehydratase [Campylobacterales bacterium]
MQKLFEEVNSLDKRCYDEFGLSEDILMEHAANGMASFIRTNFEKNSTVSIVVGSGNNGADGIALARILHGDYDVGLFYTKEPKSKMALLQHNRSQAVGVKILDELNECDILVDAIVGTGFSGEFDENISSLIKYMNSLKSYKIACDIPSGYKFYADATLTMGALKKEMFLDAYKDYIGDVWVLELGVTRGVYESYTNWYLLDMEDLNLPNRYKKDTHKGSFGHLSVACGQKSGASIMSASAALRFGTGLVTLVGFEDVQVPHSLMYSHALPNTTTALALGMGLGNEFSKMDMDKFLDNSYPLIADADIFYMDILKELLKRKNVVLTPHPKEFVQMLKMLNLADIEVEELQKNRFEYVEMFCKNYPDATLLLKGANVIIAQSDTFFINHHGTSKLSKGGSGDVLSGLIGALLAQGFYPLDAAINASLAHSKLALDFKGADFSLTPDDLINGICNL